MATAVQVLHIEKRVSIASGLNRHITRQHFITVGEKVTVQTWVPDNANPNKTANNKELISREIVNSKGQKITLTLQQAVDNRIKNAGVKPRKGQSTCLEMIFSGSRDAMNAMSKEELRQWAEDTVEWSKETWGEENVVSASLHVDESTPHIHMIVVPIVTGQSRRTKNYKDKKSAKSYKINHDKLRLCTNEVYTQKKLYEYHDSYAEKVSVKYGLSRGVKAEQGSKKKHTNSEEYNRNLAKQISDQQSLISSLQADYNKKEQSVSKLQENIDIQNQKIKENAASIEEQENKISLISLITLEEKEKELVEKRKDLSSLKQSILVCQQDLIHIEDEVKEKKADLEQIEKKIKANAKLEKVPKKGLLGYKAEEVEAFIESVQLATLKSEMNKKTADISEVNRRYQSRVFYLESIEREYNNLINSPELLESKLEELRKQEKYNAIKSVIEYVMGKEVSYILSYTIDETPRGEEIFATYKLYSDSKQYALHIHPNNNFRYTSDSRVTSLQKAREISKENIWHKGNILEIREKKEQEKANKKVGLKISW